MIFLKVECEKTLTMLLEVLLSKKCYTLLHNSLKANLTKLTAPLFMRMIQALIDANQTSLAQSLLLSADTLHSEIFTMQNSFLESLASDLDS